MASASVLYWLQVQDARWPAIVLLYVRELRLTAESGGAGGQFIEATARRRALPLGGTASVSSRRDTPRC